MHKASNKGCVRDWEANSTWAGGTALFTRWPATAWWRIMVKNCSSNSMCLHINREEKAVLPLLHPAGLCMDEVLQEKVRTGKQRSISGHQCGSCTYGNPQTRDTQRANVAFSLINHPSFVFAFVFVFLSGSPLFLISRANSFHSYDGLISLFLISEVNETSSFFWLMQDMKSVPCCPSCMLYLPSMGFQIAEINQY